jgi:heme exporter protein D
MMSAILPDLGKYAMPVLASYGSGLILLIGLVCVSVWQGRKAKAALDAVESKDQSDA